MGVYAEVDIYATYNTEENAEAAFINLEQRVEDYIKSKIDDVFHLSLTEVDLKDECIIVKICSPRYQNAEWQSEQLFNFMKEKTSSLEEFTAEITSPKNIIWWNKEEV